LPKARRIFYFTKTAVFRLPFFFVVLFLLMSSLAGAQHHEKELTGLATLIQKGATDSVRLQANSQFKSYLKEYLRQHAVPEKNLPDSLKSVSLLVAPDKTFRIVSWIVPSTDQSHTSFFGFLQRFDKKKGTSAVIELSDVSDTLQNPQSVRLKDGAWFGAVYYELVARKKSGKQYYTLLGWKGNNKLTTKKVIDVIWFSNDKVFFGYPHFKTGKTYQQRVIFEYTAAASMALRYEEKENLIVFDHLSVPSNIPSGEGNMAQFLGPDGTYDALEFKKGRWNLLKDIEIGTNWKPKKN
jgi:hypothetical protein